MNFAISSLESTAITGEVLPLYCKYVYLVYFTVSNIVCGYSKLWAEPKTSSNLGTICIPH